MSDRKLFFDTDCISAFLWVGVDAILPKLYPGRIIIPEPVYNEISNPRISHLKQRIDILKAKGLVKVAPIQFGEPEYDLYMKMANAPEKGKTIIGKGEASVLALAKEREGIVASNNLRDIMQYINEFKLAYMTTGDIMIEAYEKSLITEEQGNSIWASMLAKRRKLGAISFSEYLKRNISEGRSPTPAQGQELVKAQGDQPQ